LRETHSNRHARVTERRCREIAARPCRFIGTLRVGPAGRRDPEQGVAAIALIADAPGAVVLACRHSGTPPGSDADETAQTRETSQLIAWNRACCQEDAMDDPLRRATFPDRLDRLEHCRRRVMLLVPVVGIVLNAVAGLPLERVLVLVGVAIVAAAGLACIPEPGGAPCKHHSSFATLVVASIGVAVAIAVTGGLDSPMVPMMPAPVLLAWTTYGPVRETQATIVLFLISLAVMPLLPGHWTHVDYSPVAHQALIAWALFASVAATSAQIGALFAGLRRSARSLDCVRRGVLDDAASRRRGLEVLGTKLAHELKNPLAAIKSLLQLESGIERDERSKRRLEVVRSEVARMEAILRDYLSFSRPLDDLSRAEIDVAALVEEVTTVLAGRADAAGIKLGHRGRTARIHADARQLREALLNLVSNALEATPRGGTVEVLHELDGELVRIAIADSGIGMTAQVAERIGTPFFTTREHGTGLGVVLARAAIVQHGGTLDFAGRPEGGTIARIALPREDAHG